MTTSATEAAASAGIVITITGSAFGMPFECIMAGFVGALVAKTFVLEPVPADKTRLQLWLIGFLQLSAAGLLAGLMSPTAEAVVAGMLPAKVAPAALQITVSGVIGMIAPVVVPLLRKLADKLASRP